jgi:hypothetical protein
MFQITYGFHLPVDKAAGYADKYLLGYTVSHPRRE